MTAILRPLEPSDRAAWEPLWEAYQRFYEVVIPPETTDLTWARFHDPDEPMHALGAFGEDGSLVGIVHSIFHRSCWLPQWTCYLQDLYVENSQRGLGTGAALIDAVADLARQRRRQALLDDARNECHGAAALRQDRRSLRLHPVSQSSLKIGLAQRPRRAIDSGDSNA